MDQAEQWRPIPGFPGYEASSLGRIGSSRQEVRRILRVSPDRYGYLRVTLRLDGRARKSRRVHSCVAAAFLGPRPKGLEVRHLDGNQVNNHLVNLKYGTRRENILDALAHGSFIAGRPVKTHCPQGHAYTEFNTYVNPRGARTCRTCKRATAKGWRATPRAA